MASKLISLFLLGVVHATADSDEAWKIGQAMSKFMPGVNVKLPSVASQNPAVTRPTGGAILPTAISNTVADLEAQTQQMKVEYQRLRARIEKLPQAEQSSASFGWLAGMVASIGLAASVGVAAVRKYTTQGPQGSESTTASQIALPLVPHAPQRAGPIVAMAEAKAKAKPKAKAAASKADSMADLQDLAKRLNPVIGYYDPLGLSRQNFWEQGNDATIAWLRHSEIKHGRVAMAGFVGYILHENGIHWPWPAGNVIENVIGMPGGPRPGAAPTAQCLVDMCVSGPVMPDVNWYQPFEGLSAPDIWWNYPEDGRKQIILLIGFFEIWSESSIVLGEDGQKHYMRGGKPGYFPSFDLIPHPVPFNLYDPLNFNKNKTDEWKASKLVTEINNGRLAMLGLLGLLAESKSPGAVPPFSGLGIKQMVQADVMVPWGDSWNFWQNLPWVENAAQQAGEVGGNMIG